MTGADFGITSYLSGLTRMFQLGEVTSSKRRLMRGMDGGSENVNFATLGMNSTLVHELHEGSINEIQQHRLVPDHSHYWLTDGTFSVIEGWLCHDGFPGCATVWDLIEYLRLQFSKAANYKDKRVEISCLLVTYAFTKWFDGCIRQDEIKRIGQPLVWRHWWSVERQEVIVQYKMALSDEGSFEKDEWGPWLESIVETNNPQTGRVEATPVLRSDPRGVPLMHKYPDISVDPGVTPWQEDESWKRGKVFEDLARWQYTSLSSADADVARAKWVALGSWHDSHQTSDTVVVGQPVSIDGDQLPTPLLSWAEMWRVLKTHVPALAPAPAPAASSSNSRLNRQQIGDSNSAVEVNVVLNPHYTEKDQRVALLKDRKMGAAYVKDNLEKEGALFLIELEHCEGELPVGLGRRTFDATLDDPVNKKYAVEWFERKNKKVVSWGKQPGFRVAIASYDKRQPIVMSSVEPLDKFLPIVVKTTPSTEGSEEPALSQACTVAVRSHFWTSEGGEEDDEEDMNIRPTKVARKSKVVED